MLRRALAIASATLVIAVGAPTEVRAASCGARVNPREALVDADAAFIGQMVGGGWRDRRLNTSDGEPLLYEFRVDDVIKGSLGRRVTFQEGVVGTFVSTQMEWHTGDRAAIFLVREDGRWRYFGSCVEVRPESLLDASRALPRADPSRVPRFLLTGSLGRPSAATLDVHGRPVAYAADSGEIIEIDVCPGGRYTAEIVADGDWYQTKAARLAVRNASTLRVVRQQPIGSPGNDDPKHPPLAVRCLDPNARDVRIITGPSWRTSILRMNGRRSTEIMRIHTNGGRLLSDGSAVVTSGAEGSAWSEPARKRERPDRLISVSARGEVSEIYDFEAAEFDFPVDLSVSEDDRYVAGIVRTRDDFDKRLFIANIESRKVRFVDVLGPKSILWARNRLVVTDRGYAPRTLSDDPSDGSVKVYSPSGRLLATSPAPALFYTAAEGDALYAPYAPEDETLPDTGTAATKLTKTSLSSGRTDVLATFAEASASGPVLLDGVAAPASVEESTGARLPGRERSLGWIALAGVALICIGGAVLLARRRVNRAA